MTILSYLLLTVSGLGIVYLAIANAVTLAFARRPIPASPVVFPTVTVLKPVAGLEPDLYENLASFCDQDYPQFDVIFCVHDAEDPALPTIERVVAAFPHRAAQVLVGNRDEHRNPKIANLSKGAAAARGDVVVIADSDVRVGPTYLRALAASFKREHTGAVTCLYRAVAADGIVAQLGAAYIEEQFAPSVLVAATFARLRFCLGATVAVRRDVLASIGGIDALGPYLADDHRLGELVAGRGFDVELSRYVVATTIPETTLRDLWSHELRWARTNFVLAPVGYALSFLMFPVPLALIYLLVSHDARIGAPLLAIAIALRLALHYGARLALGVRRAPAPLLAPIRDIVSLALWAASLFGRSVRWRKTRVAVDYAGRMHGKS